MQNEIKKIDNFKGEYYFLSNFYESPVIYDGIVYRNNEAAFQAQKSLSIEKRKEFSQLSPNEAKRLGRRIFLRRDWERVKENIMLEIVRAKFNQNPTLAKALIDTKDFYLEEGNNWGDRIWGTVNGEGENRLGKILMKVRDELMMDKQFRDREISPIERG